jgi:hypothetical protein
MTVQPAPDQFTETLHDFRHERSDWIDGFARFEAMVRKLWMALECSSSDPRKVPLSVCLNDLRKAEPSQKMPKDRIVVLRRTINRCEPLLQIRASIVHGVMVSGRMNDEPVAMFHNALDRAQDSPYYLVMAGNDWRRTASQLNGIAGTLNNFSNPATPQPSPRPPAPGAADGP